MSYGLNCTAICPLAMLALYKELVLVVAVDETIVIDDPNRRAGPRSNYNDQHPLAERPKYATTRVSVKD